VSKKRNYLLAILGTLALLILIAWSPWSALFFRGDGKFSDELIFYPRYWVRFADIPLNEVGEHHFRFRGIPHEEMSLILYFKGITARWENRESLMNFQATIEAKLTDGQGKIACHASGRPADGNRDGIWILMSGPGEAGFWHHQCNFVPLSPFRSYDLMIRITDVGPGVDKVAVTPTLKGGGMELP
jgi:hypothetical protein